MRRRWGTRGGPRPGSSMSLVETKLAAHFFVNLQFAKIGRGLWPLHAPASSGDKIALMRAIPKMSAELDRYKPAKSEKEVRSTKRPRGHNTLLRQPCRLQLLHSRRRHAC